MIPSYITQRLNDLEDNISKDLKLLKRYEDALRLESNPKLQESYEGEIEKLRESATQYKQELKKVQEEVVKISGRVALEEDSISNQLDSIAESVRVLQGGQIAILGRLDQTRQILLEHYTSTQKALVSGVVYHLNVNQLHMTQLLLEQLEVQSYSETQQILAVLEQKFPALPSFQAVPNGEIIQDPEIAVKHRLMLTVPFIPGILGYEGEIEFTNGCNMTNAWDWLMKRIGR